MRFKTNPGGWGRDRHPDELGKILRNGDISGVLGSNVRVGDLTARQSEDWDGLDLEPIVAIEP